MLHDFCSIFLRVTSFTSSIKSSTDIKFAKQGKVFVTKLMGSPNPLSMNQNQTSTFTLIHPSFIWIYWHLLFNYVVHVQNLKGVFGWWYVPSNNLECIFRAQFLPLMYFKSTGNKLVWKVTVKLTSRICCCSTSVAIL